MNIKKLLFIFTILSISFFASTSVAKAGTTDLKGWAWSDGAGWISFNCANGGTNTCKKSQTDSVGVDYKVQISTTTDTTTGIFSGWAWSSNVGWIKFTGEDTLAHPNPTVDLTTGAVSGWIRACAGTVLGNCTGDDRTDGWDGWINLAEKSDGLLYPTLKLDGSGGLTYNTISGFIPGKAWGSTNIGWLTFLSEFTNFSPNIPPTTGGRLEANCVAPQGGVRVPEGGNAYPLVGILINPTRSTDGIVINAKGGTGSYTYTTPQPTIPSGRHDVTFTVSDKDNNNVTISCSVNVLSNGPGLKMWIQNPTDLSDTTLSSIRVKLGQTATLKWEFVNAPAGTFTNCRGRINESPLTEDSGTSPLYDDRISNTPAGTPYTIRKALINSNGTYRFKMSCTKEGVIVSAFVYDKEGNPTGVNELQIVVGSAKIIEI